MKYTKKYLQVDRTYSEMLTDNLKLQVSDYQYWMNLVYRLGFDAAVYQPAPEWGSSSLMIPSQYIDSMQFHSKDIGKDQTISALDVTRALCQQKLYNRRGSPEADTAFEELIDMMSIPSSGEGCSPSSARQLQLPAFLVASINLRLAAICHGASFTGQDLCMNLHEYSEDQLNSARPLEDPVAFLFRPASELFLNPHINVNVAKTKDSTRRPSHPVKWLHAHKASKRVIMGLTLKYRLDTGNVFRVFRLGKADADNVSFCEAQKGVPTGTASSLNNRNSASPVGCTPNLMGAPSVDLPMWFFMVLPILRLSDHSRSTLRKYQAWQERVKEDANRIIDETLGAIPCVEIIIEHCNLAMFVSSVTEGNTAISFSSDWAELMQFNTVIEERTCALNNWWSRRRTNNISTRSSSAGGPINQTPDGSNNSGTGSTTLDRGVLDTAQLSMFNKALASIRMPYSKLRSGDAHTFLLKVLSDISEDYLLIAEACNTCLLILDRRLNQDQANVNAEEIRRLQKYLRQLSELEKIVGPVAKMTATSSFRQQWKGDNVSSVVTITSNLTKFLNIVSRSKDYAMFILNQCILCSERNASFAYCTRSLAVSSFNYVIQFMRFLETMMVQHLGIPSIPEIWWGYGSVFCLYLVMFMCIIKPALRLSETD